MQVVCLGVLIGLIALSAPTRAIGCDAQSGERLQLAFLEWNGQSIDIWEVVSAEPKRLVLPNGFDLGLSIEPAAPDKYAADWQNGRHVPELVEVTLFDAAAEPARRLTTTWAGANSIQGYGADGGADRVEQLGSPGITLTLLKPVCARPEGSVSAAPASTPDRCCASRALRHHGRRSEEAIRRTGTPLNLRMRKARMVGGVPPIGPSQI